MLFCINHVVVSSTCVHNAKNDARCFLSHVTTVQLQNWTQRCSECQTCVSTCVSYQQQWWKKQRKHKKSKTPLDLFIVSFSLHGNRLCFPQFILQHRNFVIIHVLTTLQCTPWPDQPHYLSTSTDMPSYGKKMPDDDSLKMSKKHVTLQVHLNTGQTKVWNDLKGYVTSFTSWSVTADPEQHETHGWMLRDVGLTSQNNMMCLMDRNGTNSAAKTAAVPSMMQVNAK